MTELYNAFLTLQAQINEAAANINEILDAAQSTIEMCGTFAKFGIAAIIILLVLVISVLARQTQIERKIDEISEEIKSLDKYISGGE